MLKLSYSNQTEALLEQLAERLEGRAPWEPVHLVVPNGHLKEYVRTALARRLGIAANLRFCYLGGLAGLYLGEDAGRVLDATRLRVGLLGALEQPGLLQAEAMAPVKHYLEQDPGGLKRIQFTGELARVLEEYQLSRPEWTAAWRENRLVEGLEGADAWQCRLWREAVAFLDGQTPEPHLTLLEALQGGAGGPRRPRAIHAFALSHVAEAYQALYRAFVPLQDTTLHLYALNPCAEFWEDLRTGPALPRREELRRGAWDRSSEDFYGLASQGPRALRLWGRPGREHIRLLNEISDCDFCPGFREPTGDTLLARMQRDLLNYQEPDSTDAAPGPRGDKRDPSLRLLAAPSPRREAEIVATGIWRLLEDHQNTASPLTFSDIAVLVPPDSLELYQAHLQAAFTETHGIPMVPAGRDVPEMQELLEAAELLLELPTTGLTRAAVLRVIQHRAILREREGADPGAWPRWCEDYGIIRGADRSAWEGTYVDHDLLNWDQGLKRMSLGAFMGEGTELEVAGEGYRVMGAREEPSAAAFTSLVRGLCTQTRGLLETRKPPREWMEHLATYLESWLEQEEGEEAEGVLRALERIRRFLLRPFEGCPPELALIGFAAARELALEALAGLREEQPAGLARGVVVSTCEALRAVPFRAVFCMGLGEGSFPTRDQRSPLDLRRKGRKPGDVSRTERQKYTFLETLLSTREHLFLSYVAMDELSGEPAQPSGLLLEFRELLGAYLGPEWAPGKEGDPVLESHPLRRFDPCYFAAEGPFRSYAPLAWEEARARGLGEAARAAHQKLPLAVGDLEGLLPGDRHALREALALPVLPAAAPAPELLRLSLSDLRSFLECPLSGAARVRLGMRKEETGDRSLVEDEPFEQNSLESSSLRREVTLEALRSREEAGAVYERTLRRLQESGQAPLGLFADAQRQEDLALIRSWLEHLREEGAPATWRLGTNRGRQGQADHAEPALGLELTLGDRLQRVELVGDLRVQLGGSLYLEKGEPPITKSGDLAKGASADKLRKKALGAFLDHLVLSCVAEEHGGHRARFVFTEVKYAQQECCFTFPPLGPEEARAQLESWIVDLLSGRHDILMPIEAVIQHWSRRTLSSETILEYVEGELKNEERSFFSTLTGPVPDPLRYPPPGDPTTLAGRRLGAFLEVVCPIAPEENA
nr:exodeoxyribonuclease V subunit gamma [uncultured Holophaga sp.]